MKDDKCTAKCAVWKASEWSVIIFNRIKRLKYLKLLVRELKEELSDEFHLLETLQRMRTIQLQIKLERTIGHRMGSLWWPVHIIILIWGIILNGNPHTDIPNNIQTMSAALTGIEVNELQSLFRIALYVWMPCDS